MSPSPDPHRGGCWWCAHARREPKLACVHPDWGRPLPFPEAREDEARCGSRGRYWAPRLELTAELAEGRS